MVSVWLPQGISSRQTAVNFQADVLENKHVCTRECSFEKICGNVWRCTTSYHVHVCDHNCDQRLAVDNYSEVCRLSKQVFPRTTQPMGESRCACRGNPNAFLDTSSLPSCIRKRSCGDDAAQCVKRQNSGVQPLVELPAWDVQARCAYQQQPPQQQQAGCMPWNMDQQSSMCWQPQ